MMRWAVGTCLTLVLGASGVHAQGTPPTEAAAGAEDGREDEARNLFLAGRSAYDAGRFAEALPHFERAYQLSARPALLFNLGTTHDRLFASERAIHYFERYLEEVPDADNRAFVESRLRILRQAEQDEDPTPASAGPSVLGIVLVAAGGAALATGAAMGGLALARRGDLDDRCPGGVCPDEARADVDSLRRSSRTADVLLPLGGALVVGGVLAFVLAGGDEDDAPEVGAAVGREGALLRVRGRF